MVGGVFGWFGAAGIQSLCGPEGVQVAVGGISTGRGLQQDVSEHGEEDGDHLLGVVVALSEGGGDLLLVQQTWKSRLDTRTPQWSTSTRGWWRRTSSPSPVGHEL